jgi:hypothetical protein
LVFNQLSHQMKKKRENHFVKGAKKAITKFKVVVF